MKLASLLFCFTLAVFAAPPRIAIVYDGSGETTPPDQIERAAATMRDVATLQVFTTSGVKSPLTAATDLAAFDLVLTDGASDSDAKFAPQLAAAAARTKLIAIGSDKSLAAYWSNTSQENYRRMIRYAAANILGRNTPLAEPPIVYLEQSFYHPDAPTFFPDFDSYRAWYSRYNPERLTVSISFNRSFYTQGKLNLIDALIRSVERHGANAVVLMSKGSAKFDPYLLKDGKPIADVLLFQGERLNYLSYEAGIVQARALGLPVLGLNLHSKLSASQWRADPGGFAPTMTANLVDSEQEGIFEPMFVGSNTGPHEANSENQLLPEQVEWRVERALAWAKLRRAANSGKRVVFTYWSEGGGKANVGGDPDDFLDVPASLVKLMAEMKQRGYDLGGAPLPDRDSLVRRMSLEASNVGNWAPGELARRIKNTEVVLLPEATYLSWFNQLPTARREEIVATWGPPPGRIMVHTDEAGKRFLVIPKLQFGNVLLAPHPDWGYLQDQRALLSGGALPPHHQYLAFFLWLQKDFHADAWVSMFTNIVLQPGKSEGPAADDQIGILLGAIPQIHPEKLGSNGGISSKRKSLALTPGWFNTVVPSDATERLGELHARLNRYAALSDRSLRPTAEAGIREEAARLRLDHEVALDAARTPFPALERELNRYLAEIEHEHMPLGSHVLGVAPEGEALVAMVAGMLGEDFRALLANPEVARKLVATVVLNRQEPARAVLEQLGHVDKAVEKQMEIALDYAGRLGAAPRESESILEALEGRRIEPGPMDEPIRQPDSVPPGRNVYGFNQRLVPTAEAEVTGRAQAEALISAYRERHQEEAPKKLAFVLFSADIAKNNGVTEAEILYLLGTRAVRNGRGEVIGVSLIPRAELNRPRIDVLVTTSGTYRDHYQDKVDLVAQAVRLASESPEADNPVSAATLATRIALIKRGEKAAKAEQLSTARVFSPAPNAYSPSIQFLAKAGDERGDDNRMVDLYTRRFSNAYGGGLYGEYSRSAFEQNLKRVDAATLTRSGNVNGVLDDPMPAGFLGGLNMAARAVNGGRETDLYVNDTKDPKHPNVETLSRNLHRELRTRYFNPKWIEGMKEHGYDGARYVMDLTDNLGLWNTTAKESVSSEDWTELKQTYIDDRYKLGLAKFFQQNNPYAKQVMVANLLQVAARGQWTASPADLADLGKQLAESVAKNGAVCEANVCRNQQLTKLVGQALRGMPHGASLMNSYRRGLAAVQGTAPQLSSVAATPTPKAAAGAPVTPVPPIITGKAMERVKNVSAALHRASPWFWVSAGFATLLLLCAGWFRRSV